MLDLMAHIKGLPVIVGLVLVIVSFIAQFVPALSFLVAGQWLLHLGVIIGMISEGRKRGSPLGSDLKKDAWQFPNLEGFGD